MAGPATVSALKVDRSDPQPGCLGTMRTAASPYGPQRSNITPQRPADALRVLRAPVRRLLVRDRAGVADALCEDTPQGRAFVARWRKDHPQSADRLHLVSPAHMTALSCRALATPLTKLAQSSLVHAQPEMSARETLWGWQKAGLAVGGLSAVLWGLAHPVSLFVLFNAVFAFFYLSLGMGRAIAVLAAPSTFIHDRTAMRRTPDADLPRYSVLVPIYDEAAIVPQLVQSLAELDYPRDKLEVIILAEEDDVQTLQALSAAHLPTFICVVRVPPSQPRTKPKALNIGLALARGRYVTIYDAEDRPEINQLRLAVEAFEGQKAKPPKRLACVQASLNITNANASLLTRHFALDYLALFDVFLPALSRFNLPIPLGGTSNHFRRDVLVEVGGWDPFNVTEDADLGIRLARLGYGTQMIASTTYEEAPTRFGPWIRQRSRWFKGWWQTWLVHMRQPVRLLRELGPTGFLVFQILVLGMLISVLIHPIFLIVTLWAFSGFSGPLFTGANGLSDALMTLNIANFVMGYLAAAALSGAGAERRGVKGTAPVIVTIPWFWMCLSAAGVLALWDLVRRPHHWHKTPHGQPGVG